MNTPTPPVTPSSPAAGATPGATPPPPRPPNFVEQIIEADTASGKWGGRVHTRFPPEPNGYLHVGHAKSICLNFGLAMKYGGKFNLRFDDTNPAKEEQEYVDSIKRDVMWLGADWTPGSANGGGLFFASDYFEKMYGFAQDLVRKGRAYVCGLSAEEVSARRGKPGVPATSPHRDRPAEESLRLLEEMKAGKHPDGSMTLRARIDLASPNFNLRDPVMYRVLHEHHHNTGDAWCIYPMYDWAHGIEDALEGITHSICTLEFEDHRPLYDWFIDAINEGRGTGSTDRAGAGPAALIPHPQQIEFAKYRPTFTVLSKRNLLRMVQDGIVSGWDDPRMPTISALRRRGFTPGAIRAHCEEIGVTKVESHIDIGRLENAVRDHLNRTAPRRMAVLRPLRVLIENYPEGKTEEFEGVNNPEDATAGSRTTPFSREIVIERDDFLEIPPKKFFRMTPGQEVRLRWAYIVRCTGVEKDGDGNITLVRCTYDPATRGGDIPLGPDGKPSRKVQGTIHWVSAEHAVRAEVRLFDRLFTAEEPGKRTGEWRDDLNPHSLEVIKDAMLEPSLAGASFGGAANTEHGCEVGERFQFERLGYFCVDRDSRPGALVLNRTVTLKDTWAKEAARNG